MRYVLIHLIFNHAEFFRFQLSKEHNTTEFVMPWLQTSLEKKRESHFR